jgi:hypothetical protein
MKISKKMGTSKTRTTKQPSIINPINLVRWIYLADGMTTSKQHKLQKHSSTGTRKKTSRKICSRVSLNSICHNKVSKLFRRNRLIKVIRVSSLKTHMETKLLMTLKSRKMKRMMRSGRMERSYKMGKIVPPRKWMWKRIYKEMTRTSFLIGKSSRFNQVDSRM